MGFDEEGSTSWEDGMIEERSEDDNLWEISKWQTASANLVLDNNKNILFMVRTS